jgi:homogentisate 1,2-dioxygenase
MTPHGPDSASFEEASNIELKPVRVAEGSMGMLQCENNFSVFSNDIRLTCLN